MSSVAWLELSLTAPADHAPELELALEGIGYKGWVVLQEEPELHWQLYLAMEEGYPERLNLLRDTVAGLGGCLESGPQVHDEDWAENWKRFYHPLRVGRRLIVCPSWEDYAPEPEDLVMILDPGSAFGTGYHWSTRLCLELLEASLDEQAASRLLDLGTGSGILAIAAHLLGVPELTAIDNDPTAVRVANENFALNRISAEAVVGSGPPADRQFPLVTANLIATLLIELAEPLARSLEPGARLVAGGIIVERAEEVVEAMQAQGLRVLERRDREEWAALLLSR